MGYPLNFCNNPRKELPYAAKGPRRGARAKLWAQACTSSRAFSEAWAWEASRVTVNTCSLDHPGALSNYRSRGFDVYRTVTENRAD